MNDYQNRLEWAINNRVATDWHTDAGMAILLSIITCGIYGLYVYYKLMERRDEHFKRMAAVADTSIAWLRERAAGREQAIAPELQELEQIRQAMTMQSAERGAAVWLLLLIFTSCVGYLIFFYLLMKDWREHDAYEARFFTLMSSALTKVGLSQQAGQAAPNIPEREFVTYAILSFVTCGIYALYWTYVMIDDGNKHLDLQVSWEDYILASLRG